jgi:glycosyltransferase involved in cell wall biosynthesis
MSSLTEGLGSAILEAMACGKPVVGTRTGGIPEAVVDGTTGLLVPPRDDAALASAIRRLLADRDRREQYGRAGRARAEASFSADALVEGTARVYAARESTRVEGQRAT